MTAALIITPESIVRRLKSRAETGFYDGLVNADPKRDYFNRCMFGWRKTPDYGIRLIYTRDIGYHTGGWFKNPDYERCYHLSLSFWCPGYLVPDEPLPQDHAAALEWCSLFFGDDRRMLWVEPPYSDAGRKADVYHYRLFCDPAWRALMPRGEVYTRDFTEKGWKSFSELHAEDDLKDAEFSMGDPS